MLVSSTDREGEQGDVGGRQSGCCQTGLGRVQIPLQPPPFTSLTTTSFPPPQASGGPQTISLQHFGRIYSWLGSAGHPRRACWSWMLGVRSICSPTEKEAVRNKQTDRQVERTQIIPNAASQHCLFPCYILPIHLFKSAVPHSLTVHLTTYSCESSRLKLMPVLNGPVSFYRVSAPCF